MNTQMDAYALYCEKYGEKINQLSEVVGEDEAAYLIGLFESVRRVALLPFLCLKASLIRFAMRRLHSKAANLFAWWRMTIIRAFRSWVGKRMALLNTMPVFPKMRL